MRSSVALTGKVSGGAEGAGDSLAEATVHPYQRVRGAPKAGAPNTGTQKTVAR